MPLLLHILTPLVSQRLGMGYAHSEETLMFHTLFLVCIGSLGRRREGKPLEEAELDNDICTPEAVQIKAPRLTIYPVTAQEVSTREHEQWASWGPGICISPG